MFCLDTAQQWLGFYAGLLPFESSQCSSTSFSLPPTYSVLIKLICLDFINERPCPLPSKGICPLELVAGDQKVTEE